MCAAKEVGGRHHAFRHLVRDSFCVPRFSQFPSINVGLARKQGPLRGHDTIGEVVSEVNASR